MNGSWPQAKMTLYLAKPLLLDKGPQRAKISFPAGWFPYPAPHPGWTRMAERPLVIVTRKLPDVVETRLRELFDARLNLDDTPLSREQLVESVKTADVLVPTVTDRIDRSVLSQAGPQLKLIAQFGTGVDNIDLETARNRSILVTNTPGVLTEDTADMTMALILAVPPRRGLLSVEERQQRMAWLVADLDARPSHLRQAARHCRHGAHRPGRRQAGARLRPADPLSQPPARRAGGRKGARGYLLGQSRSDARAHGHHLHQLPAYAGDLSSPLGAAARADEAVRLYRQHGARRGDRRERARPH